MLNAIKKNWVKILLLLILAVGAYLRLWRIGEYMTFLGDEGRDVLIVRKMIVEGDITFLGPTASVGGFFLGPIYYYFMTPFLWLWNFNPTGPAIMVALFGIATIYLVYKAGSEFFNKQAGLFAAALYAVSPLVIAHSRSSWNPNLVPFFSLLYIYGLHKSVATKNRKWYFITGASLGVGLQLHYLFTFLIPVGIVYLVINYKKLKSWKNIFSAGAGAVFTLFPFIAFEIKNKFPNTQTIIRFIFTEDDVTFASSSIGNIVSDVIFRLYGRLVFYFPPPEQFYKYSEVTLANWKNAVLLGILLSLIGLKNKLLSIWLLFGVGLFILYSRAIYDYYLGIMFVLPFLLIGYLLSLLWLASNKLKPVSLAILIGLVALNLSGRPFKYPPNKQLEQVEKISRLAFDKANDKPFNFALITNGNSDHGYRYFFELWDNPPIIIENPDIDPNRNTVTDQLLIICESRPCEPLGHPLWEVAGFGQAEIAGEWDISFVKVFKLTPYED